MFCVSPELLLLRVCKKEELVDDQLSVNQDRKSSLKQEECGHAQFKEEPGELPITSELRLKQEPGDPEWTSVKEENPKSEGQTVDWHPEESSEESGVNVPVITSVVSLSNCQLQKLTANSDDSYSLDRRGGKREDFASKDLKRRCHAKQTNTVSPSSTCDKCGKDFKDQ